MSSIAFVVEAKPVSTNQSYRAGQGRFWKTRDAVAYMNAVKLTARRAAMVQRWDPVLKGTVHVSLAFTFESPLSDVDGCIKGTLDALEGCIYSNDRQVSVLTVTKQTGKPGSVAITVTAKAQEAA